MKNKVAYFVILSIVASLIWACDKDDDPIEDGPTNEIEVPDGYSLVWSDEFNESTIDMGNWQYETGDGTDYGLPPGWGNNELQMYTSSADNSGIVTDDDVSALSITALKAGAEEYASAKLTTQNKISVRFGRVDVKAKLPDGQGIWSAIWMLGDNIDQVDWPGCGEIDIAELLGHEPNKIYSTVHFTNGERSHEEIQDSYSLSSGNFSDDYHVFSVDWTPETLTFSVDEMVVHQVQIEDDMKEFLRSFYLILNVAVGGNWPGYPDNSTTFPQTMYVDYVRVFEKNGFTAPTAPALDIDEETIGQDIEPSLAQHAIKNSFYDLGNANVVVYGGGGEPVVSASELAVDGDSSLMYNFPGGSWGGGYIELDTVADLSAYTNIHFSLNLPENIADAEIKLESPSTNAAIFLINYTGSDAGLGFTEFIVPLSDFEGLDLTEISIPFAVWNPKDADNALTDGTVLIDNVYFSD